MDIRQEYNYRNAVMNMQRYLRQLEHGKGNINKVPVDGIFGEDTRNALMRFQESVGLPVTGIADAESWDRLFAEYNKSLIRNSSANGIFPFFDLPDDYELSIGDNNTLVSVLEIMLNELSTEYTEFQNAFLSNGIFDKEKSDLIFGYQIKNMIPASGKVDRVTWNHLADDFNFAIRKNQ